MTFNYNEDNATLRIYEGSKVYRYIDVPLSVFRMLDTWYKKGYRGRVWQTVRKYEETNHRKEDMMTEKLKMTIKELSDGEYYSLQDVSVLLEKDKHDVMERVRKEGISTIQLFNKYTVFTKEQVTKLAELFGMEIK